MGYPRSLTVDLLLCAIYHCVSRCVRREFLIGDAVRAAWIVQRLEFLASLFGIEVLEYAIMGNHLHLLLRIRPELTWCWTDAEIAERWLTLRAAGPLGLDVDLEARPSQADIDRAVLDPARIDEWRRRLGDLGWFHKELKEPCARLWNAEDDTTGHFWEGRYSAKVALDDVALMAQALYIQLNAVRAGTEGGVGQGERTSIGKRMRRTIAQLRAGRHGEALAGFQSRVVDGAWMPVFPCRPGSVAELSDEEYARRVARGRRNAEIRRAVRKEAETITRLAADAPVEELLPMVTVTGESPATGRGADAEAGREARREPRVPRHRLRPRPCSLPPADVRASEASYLTAMENPFRPRRDGAGDPYAPTAVLPGMTLGALIALADLEGRRVRADKRGAIAADEPRALERFRAMALGVESDAPGAGAGAGANAGAAPTAVDDAPWLEAMGALGEGVRKTVTATLGLLARHRSMVARLLGGLPAEPNANAEPNAESGCAKERVNGGPARPSRPPRIAWFGSASGADGVLAAEAKRRGVRRAVGERPVAR